MANQPKQSQPSKTQAQPRSAPDPDDRGRQNEELGRRLQRQTFNAGERDAADDRDYDGEDDVDRDVESGDEALGENRSRSRT